MRMAIKVICGILIGTAIALLLSWVTMLLWNWLMPYIFGLPVLTFWQSLGVLLLSKLIFGFGNDGHHGGPRRWKHHGDWRRRWKDKMSKMSPEQRERMMRGMRRHGWDCRMDWEDAEKNPAENPQSGTPS
jgi:hypothetical protein